MSWGGPCTPLLGEDPELGAEPPLKKLEAPLESSSPFWALKPHKWGLKCPNPGYGGGLRPPPPHCVLGGPRTPLLGAPQIWVHPNIRSQNLSLNPPTPPFFYRAPQNPPQSPPLYLLWVTPYAPPDPKPPQNPLGPLNLPAPRKCPPVSPVGHPNIHPQTPKPFPSHPKHPH